MFHLRHSRDGADSHIFILSLSSSHCLLSFSRLALAAWSETRYTVYTFIIFLSKLCLNLWLKKCKYLENKKNISNFKCILYLVCVNNLIFQNQNLSLSDTVLTFLCDTLSLRFIQNYFESFVFLHYSLDNARILVLYRLHAEERRRILWKQKGNS